MIPIRDSVRSSRFPVVTVILIAANLAVFGLELTMDQAGFGNFLLDFGLIPARFVGFVHELPLSLLYGWPILLSLVTSMFIHGGWLHVLGNMLYLWIFGDNVEDRLGRGAFLLFYLASGGLGFAAHALANPASQVPAVGASGAVAGILGAYFLMFPQARVLAVVPLGIFLQLAQVPAVLFLFFWFILQVINGLTALNPMNAMTQTVAWWAHIGGFMVGMVWVFLTGRVGTRRRRRA
jgi:membrane associated rhomboid family serine protease